jgi:hypothetical protein
VNDGRAFPFLKRRYAACQPLDFFASFFTAFSTRFSFRDFVAFFFGSRFGISDFAMSASGKMLGKSVQMFNDNIVFFCRANIAKKKRQFKRSGDGRPTR